MAKLGEVFTIASGGTPDKKKPFYYENGTIPWVKTGDLKTQYVPEGIECITEEGLDNSSAKLFPPNTVLVAMYGATIGACSILPYEAATNQACAAFLPNENVLPTYLYYFLSSKREQFVKDGVGGAQPNISAGYLKNVQFGLIPMQQQIDIVEKLDKVEKLIALRKEQLAKLDELVKSRFVEMFGHPVSNEKCWEQVPLSVCVESIDSGKSFVCDAAARQGDWPAVLKLSAATYGFYRPEENKAMIDENQFIEDAAVQTGDLLFTRKNTPELVGMCAYVYDSPSKLMMPDLIFRLNTTERCNKIFLWKLINHDFFRECIQAIATGSAKSMSNISKERLLGLLIILPPIELQEQFAAFVKQVDKSKLTIQQSLDKLELLKKTLMQQYFG